MLSIDQTKRAALSMALGLLSCVVSGERGWAADPAKKITFDDHVLPVFRNHCLGCHNANKARADLDLSTFTGVMNGSSGGQVVNAGDAGASKLYLVTAHQAEPKMPPKSAKIPDGELAVIKSWIDGGLLEKAGSKAKVSNKPKMDLALGSAAIGKPKGPIAMPQDLLIEPYVRTAKPGATHAAASNPWAPIFALAGQKQVVLYHSDTLEILGVLPFPEGVVNVVKFSRNGDLVLAGGGVGGKSGKVVVWKVATGRRVIEVGAEADAVLAADISADQSKIALSGPGKLVKVYSTKDGELVHSIKKHTDWVQAVEFSPDAVLLASGDRSGNVHVWETNSGNEFYALRGHTGPITDVAWRDDSNVLATCSEDTTIRLWEMQNGGQIKSWGAHAGGVQSVRFAHDGRMVSCGRDRVARLWDANGAQKLQFEGFGDLALKVAFSHDDARVLAGDWTGDVRIWSAADGKRVGVLALNPPTIAERMAEAEKLVATLQGPIAKLAEEHRAAEVARVAMSSDMAGVQSQAKSAADALQKLDAALAPIRQKMVETRAALTQVEAQAVEKAKQHGAAADIANKSHADWQRLLGESKAATESLAARRKLSAALGEAMTSSKVELAKAPADARLLAIAAASEQAVKQAVVLTAEAEQLSSSKTASAAKSADAAGKTKVAAEALAAELASLRKSVADRKANLVEIEKELAPKIAEWTRAKAAADAAMQQAAVKAEAIKKSTQVTAEAKQKLDRAQGDLATARKQVVMLKAARINVELHGARDELAAREKRHKELLDAAAGEQAAADKLAAEIIAVQAFVANGPKAIEAQNGEISKAMSAIAPTVQAVQAAQTVAEQKRKLHATMIAAAAAVEAAAKDNKTLTQSAAKAKEAAGLIAADVAEVDKVVAAKIAERQKAEGVAVQAKKGLEALQADLAAGPARIEKLKSMAQAGKAKVAAAQAAAAAFANAEVAAVKTRVDRLAADFARAKAPAASLSN